MKYRKKPVVIEAVAYDGGSDSLIEVAEFMGESFVDSGPQGQVFIETLEGVMEADVGDFIIKGVKGELYPCKPDIFAMTYELAVEAEYPQRWVGEDSG